MNQAKDKITVTVDLPILGDLLQSTKASREEIDLLRHEANSAMDRIQSVIPPTSQPPEASVAGSKRPKRSASGDDSPPRRRRRQNKSKTLKHVEDLLSLVQDLFLTVRKYRKQIHQRVVKCVDEHTVDDFLNVVLEGMPDFLKEQLDNEAIDLNALRDQITTDPQLRPNRRKRGRYLALGRLVDTHQTTLVALPAEVIAGSRRVTRPKPGSSKWILYGGESADSAGGIQRRAGIHEAGHSRDEDNNTLPSHRLLKEHNCTAKVLVFWEAPDESTPEGNVDPAVLTLVETFIFCRAGVHTDNESILIKKLSDMPSYGIIKFDREYIPANTAMSINSVDEDLPSREVYLFKARTNDRNRSNKDDEQQEEAENLLEAKENAINPKDTACPILGCGYVFSLVATNASVKGLFWLKKIGEWYCDVVHR